MDDRGDGKGLRRPFQPFHLVVGGEEGRVPEANAKDAPELLSREAGPSRTSGNGGLRQPLSLDPALHLILFSLKI